MGNSNAFTSISEAVGFLRQSLKTIPGGCKFTCDLKPRNHEESKIFKPDMVLIRWMNGPMHNEVKAVVESLNVTIADKPLEFHLVRTANFATVEEAVAFVRNCLKRSFPGIRFSLGKSAKNPVEYMYEGQPAIFVRWNDGPSNEEVKIFLDSLKVKALNLWVYFGVNLKY